MFFDFVKDISDNYQRIKKGDFDGTAVKMPGSVFFLNDGKILSIPGNEGDCRYPYGSGGFNFWAHASGYMHCNDGLFSIFMKASEGQEPRISFFAGFEKNGGECDVVSLLPVPALNSGHSSRAERYSVFARSCVYYITEFDGMRFTVRVFPDMRNTLHFTIGIENLSPESRHLFVSSYLNPFLKHDIFENYENRWFREVRYLPASEAPGDLGRFMFKVNEDLSRTTSVSNIAAVIRNLTPGIGSRLITHEETTSRYEYVGGARRSIHNPDSLYRGRLSGEKTVCAFTEIGIAGDNIRLDMGSCSTVRYDIEFRYKPMCMEEKDAKEIFSESLDIVKTERLLTELEDKDKLATSGLIAEFGGLAGGGIQSGVLNRFLFHLMKQVGFCSLIKGYVHLAATSMIGIRDIFQALEAFMFWEPDAARTKMLEALNYVLTDGRCPRQYTLPSKKDAPVAMDLRPFIDQGSWVITAVSRYLTLTGDMSFLDEICGYYKTLGDEKGLGVESGVKDTVLDHLIRITDYLLSNRDLSQTGCIRALYGDWNDALDGLGVSSEPDVSYGTGVSVMASLHVYQNLSEIIGILINKDAERFSAKISEYLTAKRELEANIRRYAVVFDKLGKKRIIHGWGDRRSYLVGSFSDPDGKSRLSLTSNAFWTISGMHAAKPDMEDTIVKAFEELDSKYGYKTFEPYFDKNAPGVGRIPKLPRGTAENGAVYIHASTFAVMALFMMGRPKDAWNQIYKLLPFTHDKVSCSPFVMPNSYGYNEELGIDGESMHDWQTGSSNVMFKIFIRYVFGIEPDYDCLYIQPAGWCPFGEFKLTIKIRSVLVRLEYKNRHRGKRVFFINGRERQGEFDESMKINRLKLPWGELDGLVLDVGIED